MSRSSMANLILRVRRLVGDTEETPVFDDDTIQLELDRCRCRQSLLRLGEEESRGVGGVVSFLTFYAWIEDWEESVLVQDSSYATISPSSVDYQNGVWTFSTTPSRPICVTGWTYDVNAAAVGILEQWIGMLKLEFDFQSDNQRFARNQKVQHLEMLANRYRARMLPQTATIIRSDIA